ncbi:MAG: ATP-binding cassette domain-containing protein [Clostridiales bacterium]|nr:ATP-binding cassette domain-containing protein [Clostridiales bacterium]
MLKFINIVKEYPTGESKVVALKGIDVEFRKSEFVSILGHSGCGKTTLLNIVGGLDHYTDGDMIIDGKSTKEYKDSDWDSYRNHRVGFVFQSYNLIPHQSVLANVELALTLSGVSKSERRKRAREALEKVGLGDQISKKPNQLSGGQVQRVAIARALVNNPEILLADEPTGALDSETSVQIMELLKEVARDRLVIMVTHNPDLARDYSSRIIRLVDGKIVSDSDSFETQEITQPEMSKAEIKKQKKQEKKHSKAHKTSMSFFTALALSFNNLLTKKMRTLLTSFAGSIGIIGIALILSLSNGFQLYIDSIQRETLTSYPITVESATIDMSALSNAMASQDPDSVSHGHDKVYSNAMAASMMESFSSEIWANNLGEFKKFLESEDSGIDEYISSIQYTYACKMNIFSADTSNGVNQVYPSPLIAFGQNMVSSMNFGGMTIDTSTMSSYEKYYNSWQELVDNKELLASQYDLIEGAWPDKYNEVVLIIDKNNEVSIMAIQGLGVMSGDELMKGFMSFTTGEKYEVQDYELEYKEVLGKKFKIVLQPDLFEYSAETDAYEDMSEDEEYVKKAIDEGEEVSVVGIVRPKDGSLMVATTGAIGYTVELTEYVVNKTNECELVKQQRNNPETDVFTGLPFPTEEAENEKNKKDETKSKDVSLSPEFEKPVVSTLENGGDTARASFTATGSFDFSSLPSASEEDIYAAVDERYSGSEAQQMKRTVELMLKTTLSISERKELIASLDKMLSGQSYAGVGTISGSQAYGYLRLMSKSDKLKMLYAMATADPAAAAGENPVEEEPEPEPEEPEEPEPEPYAQSLSQALEMLGAGDINTPTSINIFPVDFESKDAISAIIEKYNNAAKDSGNEKNQIKYTDYIGLLLKSVTKIVNIISYVLIAFVAISLVVSSIMIGIITYISVLERTKEIGILRAIGASKRNISTVFNAETLIVGFVSGALGIGITILLNIPINKIIQYLTRIPDVSRLPVAGGIALVCISMFLTLVAGLIPSRIASKKDPVVALRSE